MLARYLRTTVPKTLFPLLPTQLPLSFRSLHPVSCAYFARKASTGPTLAKKLQERKVVKPKEKKEREDEDEDEDEKEKEKETPLSGVEDTFKMRADPKSKEIDDKWMSLSHLDAQHLPEKFLRRAQKVFAKFPQEDVRKMGKAYMKIYQFLHAAEKPTDLTTIRPFANTSDLITQRKSLVYLGKKYREAPPPELSPEEQQKRRTEAMEKKNEATLKNQDPNTGSDQGITYDHNTALAYLQRKVPHTFGVACRILSEIKYRLPDFKPETFLDYGAGLGSGSWAFYDIYREFKKVVAIEPSAHMRKLGKYLTEDLQDISWFDSLARIVNVHDLDGLFDVVYCGFVLEEAKSAEARMLIIDMLWQKVRPNGIMILVEPGSPKGFRFIHDFRKWIVQKPRTEANIIAPCPHHGECPQAKPIHLWCNFDQAIAKYPNRVFNKLPKQSTIDYERFSFLVVKKGEVIKNKEEATTPAERSFFWPRVLRPTVRRGKHIVMDLCTPHGEIERVVVAKSHQEEGQYKHAKQIRWGDLWCFGKRIPNKYRKESEEGERLW